MDIELRNVVDSAAPVFMEDIVSYEPITTSRPGCVTKVDEKTGQKTQCSCESDAYDCVVSLLIILAGPNGVHCARWRTLLLAPNSNSPQYWDLRTEDARVANILIYPTPKLTSLSMHYFYLESNQSTLIFPYTPSLTHLALNDCILPSLPNGKSLEFLGLSWGSPRVIKYWNEGKIWRRTSAHRLKVLKLNCPSRSLPCPSSFPELQRLDLRGDYLPVDGNLTYALSPNLTHLSLGIKNRTLLSKVHLYISKPLNRLKTLKLWCDRASFYDVEELEEISKWLGKLLPLMTSLESLTGDIPILSIVLKIIWETTPLTSNGGIYQPSRPRELLSSQGIAFQVIQGESSYKIPSETTKGDIVELARVLGVINPEESWKYISQQMKGPRLGLI